MKIMKTTKVMLLIIFLVIALVSILTLLMREKESDLPQLGETETTRFFYEGISNDEIISETKKCETAGLSAEVVYACHGFSDNCYDIEKVLCIPLKKCSTEDNK